jgi:hypothetical protein
VRRKGASGREHLPERVPSFPTELGVTFGSATARKRDRKLTTAIDGLDHLATIATRALLHHKAYRARHY